MLTTNQVISLLTTFAPWIAAIVAALVSYFKTVAPWLADKRVQQFAAAVVAAAEQTIADPAQRFAYADGLLHDVFPSLKPDERKAVIEAAVTALHVTIGTFSSATAPAVPPVDTAGVVTQAVTSLLPQLEAMIEQKVAAVLPATLPAPSAAPTAKLNRSAKGQFAAGQPVTPATASLTVSGVAGHDSAEKGQ